MSGMRTIVVLSLALAFPTAGSADENWARFRGPSGTGHANGRGLPLTWEEGKNIVWKTAIHDKGWSSPVVWGDQVWVTTARANGTEMFAVCVDRATGKVVYDVRVFDVEKPSPLHNPTNTYASPTPAIEEGRVYVHFGSYGTACLDTKTAKILWTRRDLPCDHWRGPASSPIIYRDLLILTFDGHDVQYLAALDKATGKTVWKKDRSFAYGDLDGDQKKAYSTPSVFTVNGKPQLVSPAAWGTIAYDPQTGEELWKVRHGGMNTGVTPLYGQRKVFVCTSDGGLQLVAVRPDGRGDVTDTHIAWTVTRNVPLTPSLLLVGDELYMMSDGGVATCLEAKTGKEVWRERIGGGQSASPVYADGKIYFLGEDGKGVVIKAGRKFEELARNDMQERTLASYAAADGALFLRTEKHLYRIEEK